jgi:hypothetical protein
MKFSLILLIVCLNISLFGQQADSTQKSKIDDKKEQVKQQDVEQNQSTVEQGNDKNTTFPQKGNNQGKPKKNKDVFIDKDGDGISDTRAGGMGINKLRKRFRGGNHGSGSGGGNGNGGNGGRNR